MSTQGELPRARVRHQLLARPRVGGHPYDHCRRLGRTEPRPQGSVLRLWRLLLGDGATFSFVPFCEEVNSHEGIEWII